MGSVEAFKAHVEEGLENAAETSDAPYPRWVRINTLKTALEDQLESTFSGLERVTNIKDVRTRGKKRVFIDNNIPSLLAISPSVDLSKSDAYKSGSIIFQDKASCFPAHLLDPLPSDGDIIDTCSAPGNKTSHIAAILLGRYGDDRCSKTIHAFEKNKVRAETLDKMVNLAGSNKWTKIHAGQDFLRTDPQSSHFRNVGALLLDPSCSGSGIIGRDDMPELHLPILKGLEKKGFKNNSKKPVVKAPEPAKDSKKRKREEPAEALDVMVDDDGEVTAVNSELELKTRLEALSKFQLELLLHAFKYPAARKITYSTCSVHAEENEHVVRQALEDPEAKKAGWRILKRDEQIRGMKEWPVRGSQEACEGDKVLAEACIRANKDDAHGTMGFFLAGFVRDVDPSKVVEPDFLRDEEGRIVRDEMGIPVLASAVDDGDYGYDAEEVGGAEEVQEDEEWGGIDEEVMAEPVEDVQPPSKVAKTSASKERKVYHNKKRPQLIKQDKKKRKGKA